MFVNTLDQIENELMAFTRWNKVVVLPADKPELSTIGFVAFYTKNDLEYSILLEILLEMPVSDFQKEVKRLSQDSPEQAKSWTNRRQVAAEFTARNEPTFRCDVCGSTSWSMKFDPASHDANECNERLTKSVMDT